MRRTQSTNVRINQDLHDRLQHEADARGVPIVWITNKLIREALDDIRPADEFSLTVPR